ncbi:MAG: glycosyltransferase [Armatimonadia bacterium]
MQIAVDVRLLEVSGTGSSVYTANLLGGLIMLAPDHRFLLISGSPRTSLPLPVAANVTVVPSDGAALCDERWEQLVLPVELERLAPDVFWSPTLTLPMLKACPSVLTVYDLGFEAHPEYYSPELRRYLGRWVAPSCQVADHLVALSQFGREELCRTYGVAMDKVTVIGGAPGAQFHQLADGSGLGALGERLKVEGLFVLAVGGTARNKNLPGLLSAFGKALEEVGDDWTLVVAGRPGPGVAEAATQVRRLGLHEHVVFAGLVSDGELAQLYRTAGVFAFLSLYEGFGLPPLEAMASGTPVLCSRTASLPEVVGDAAYLVDPTDQAEVAEGLLALMRSTALRRQLSAAGLRRASEFSWERSAQCMLSVLERASGLRPRPRHGGKDRPARVLVSRIGARGDVLQTTPVLRAVRQRWPGAELTYHTSHAHCELLANNPDVDLVQSDSRPIATRDYDVVIDLNRAYEDAPDRAQRHRIELYARRAGVSVTDTSLVLVPTDLEYAQARRIADEHHLGEAGTVVGFGLRAVSVQQRCWFDDRWQGLADSLAGEGMRIVTFGGPGERGLDGPRVTNTMGVADMRVARALMEYCHLVVTVDTGWAHVAASAGKPIVGLFGADSPQCVLPPDGDWVAIRAELPCSPCFCRPCRDRTCMDAITVDKVYRQVLRKVGTLRGDGPAHREVVPT